MITVQYYLKGQSMQCATFSTIQEAGAFCLALSQNDNCECYGIVR